MNPWMQGVWSDVHTMLIGYIRDALGDELPADLVARAEERVMLSGPLEGKDDGRADVAVSEPEEWRGGGRPVWTPQDDPGLAERLAEPVLVVGEDLTPRWVEIRSATGRLITVIEVTSPSNKTPRGRSEFERKVRDLIQGGVNVMEIDLVRGGRGARDERSGDWPGEPCQVVVNRARSLATAEVYPCPLRDPLPAVRVPLRIDEPDAALDLQPLIDRCYAKGRYWMLPYRDPPDAELTEAELEWARRVVEEAGLVGCE